MIKILYTILFLLIANIVLAQYPAGALRWNKITGKVYFTDSVALLKYKNTATFDSVLAVGPTGKLIQLLKGKGISIAAGVDSVTLSGNLFCQWIAGVSNCYRIVKFFDSSSINYNSTRIIYWNAGVSVDSITSSVSNVTKVGTHLQAIPKSVSGAATDSLKIQSLVDSVYKPTGSTKLYVRYYNPNTIDSSLVIGAGSGSVTNVSALTLGTTGTDLSSSVANPTTTPVITLNVPTASAANRGALSAADWSIFNAKQPAGTYLIPSDTVNRYIRPIAGTNITITGTFPNLTFNSSGGGATTLAALTDVTLATLRNNQILQYDSVAAKWKNQTGLQFSLAGLANNDIFQYNSTTGLWENHVLSNGGAWSLTGNTGTTSGTNFMGTTDNQALNFKVNNRFAGLLDSSTMFKTFYGYMSGNGLTSVGPRNSAFGYYSLNALSSGTDNSANGYLALSLNTTGVGNTGIGGEALRYNVSGSYNTATGWQALLQSTGNSNTANGIQSLLANTSGGGNTGVGYQTLFGQGTGSSNTAVGTNALHSAGNFSFNTAIGAQALLAAVGNSNTAVGFQSQTNASGVSNTSSGYQSIGGNSSGSYNVANGHQALFGNTSGTGNTVNGTNGLLNNTIGSYNIAEGYQSGQYIADGVNINSITDNSIYIGKNTKAFANNQTNQIVVGDVATGMGSNTSVIGNAASVEAAIMGSLAVNTAAVRTATNIEPATASQLDVRSTTKGVLYPRMTTAQRNAIVLSSAIESLTLTPGSGYTVGTYTITFSGGGGSGAAGLLNSVGGGFSSYSITNFGSGYTSAPTASVTVPGGTGGAITVVISNLEGLTIFCTDCTATGGYTGCLQNRVAGAWRNLQ